MLTLARSGARDLSTDGIGLFVRQTLELGRDLTIELINSSSLFSCRKQLRSLHRVAVGETGLQLFALLYK